MKENSFITSELVLHPASNHKKIISALGGFIGFYSIIYINILFVGTEEMMYIVPSMGASAVLLFTVPHSGLGQL